MGENNETLCEDDSNCFKIFSFLTEHFENCQAFTSEEFYGFFPEDKFKTIRTYFSKIVKALLTPVDDDYYVNDNFRKYSDFSRFRQYFSQSRMKNHEYVEYTSKYVMLFDFFLPLNNEAILRSALDSLFFKDCVVRNLKMISKLELNKIIPQEPNEDIEDYFNRISLFVSNIFGGYSINHVQGRFRAMDLGTYNDVAKIQQKGQRYLVDETTAVVRFIFHCHEAEIISLDPSISQKDLSEKIALEEKLIRYFFSKLFTQAILDSIDEDEIWMLESGLHSELHIWKRI